MNALPDFTKAIELDPFYAQNYANRGFVYLILKEYEHAIEDYNRALELDPGCLDFYRQRALCHLCHHSLERASSDLLTAESIKNQKRNEYNETGLNFFEKGEFQQSIQSFDHLIRANPTKPIGYQNRGTVYYQLGSVDLAIDDFDHALQFAPQKGELYAMRAAAYLSVANFEKAQKDLLHVVKHLFYEDIEDDEKQQYALKLAFEIKNHFKKEWESDWKNEVFLGDLCVTLWLYDERYLCYKRAYDKLDDPQQNYYFFYHCVMVHQVVRLLRIKKPSFI